MIIKAICLLLIVPLLASSQTVKFPLSFLVFTEGSDVESYSHATLDTLARFLHMTGAAIEVGGHTDNVGSPAAKQILSEARAKKVCDYLTLKHRIPAQKLTPLGYGAGKPIATNLTEAGRRKNNRIEIKVVSPILSARFTHLSGDVLIQKPGLSDWTAAMRDMPITVWDQIQTKAGSRAGIDFGKSGKVLISPNSDLMLTGFSEPPEGISLRLAAGKLTVRQGAESIKLATPNLSLVCRDAELVLESTPYYADLISVWKGAATLYSGQDSLIISAGFGVRCMTGYAPGQLIALSSPPHLDSLTAVKVFNFAPGRVSPFEFSFLKPTTGQAHVVFARDHDITEILHDIITNDEFCSIPAVDIPVLFMALSLIDTIGLENRPVVHYFTISKATGPRLNITKIEITREKNGIIAFLEGETDADGVLRINNEPVKPGKDGRFSLRVRFKPQTSHIVLSATDRAGQTTIRKIPLARPARLVLSAVGGASDLVGGNFISFITSEIGIIAGVGIAHRLGPDLYASLFMSQSKVAAREMYEGIDEDRYGASTSITGLGLRYFLLPNLYCGVDAGGALWKSFRDDQVSGWGVDPCFGMLIGVDRNVTRKLKLLAELNAFYIFNKTQANLGSNVYYIAPRLCGGSSFSF